MILYHWNVATSPEKHSTTNEDSDQTPQYRGVTYAEDLAIKVAKISHTKIT